jgi:hypothetical protein
MVHGSTMGALVLRPVIMCDLGAGVHPAVFAARIGAGRDRRRRPGNALVSNRDQSHVLSLTRRLFVAILVAPAPRAFCNSRGE